MTIHFHGPIPEGITIHHSRRRTTYHISGAVARLNITPGGDVHITPIGGGRRGSGGRNRGQGNNRQRRQRRRGTEQARNRAENQLEPPSQPGLSARTVNPCPTSKKTENPAEKPNTSNSPMDTVKPSLPMKNTQGSQPARGIWGLTEEQLTGTADFEASPSPSKATEIGSFARTVESSRLAPTTNAIYPNEFGRAGGALATGPWDSSSRFVQSLPSFPPGPA